MDDVENSKTYVFRPSIEGKCALKENFNIDPCDTPEQFSKFDHSSMNETLSFIDNSELPKIITIYMPGLDANSHKNGPDTQASYLKDYIEPEITRLLYGDSDYSGIKGSEGVTSIYDETIIVITADHGQTSVIANDEHAISTEELGNVLESAEYELLNINVSENPHFKDAVIAPNGGMAQIYIKDRTTYDWNDPPELIDDLHPALNAFYSKPYVDKILVKYSSSGGYRVYTGNNNTQDLETFFKDKPEYINPVKRIRGLESTRSGDIILLANYNNGYYFEDKIEKGIHGGLNKDDSYIPLVFSGPTIRKGVSDSTPAMNIDIAKTLSEILGFEMPNTDGNYLPIIDKNPPTSQVNLLPPTTITLSATAAFTVSWSGTDDLSGIKSYDIQVKDDDSGEWNIWKQVTFLTTVTFIGQKGYIYYFRS
ncbi:MAG TPA: hypothetical protein VMV77_17860, partial [Bacteroidales bacterium]|nr:hypothetical protein [Bacteroidales bacterium]